MAEVSFNSPSPYQQQMSALERRQRMAEALQQQSYMPIERHSYNGIEAPISPAAGLAKMLEGLAPAMEQREIENKRGELVEGARKKGADWLTDLSQSEVPMPAGEQGPPRPKTEPEKLAHLLRGLYLDDPRIAGIASSLYAADRGREAKLEEPYTLNPGDVRMAGGREVGRAPEKPTPPPSGYRAGPNGLEAIPGGPGDPAHAAAIANAQNPYYFQDINKPDGSVERVAIPRAAVGQPGSPGTQTISSKPPTFTVEQSRDATFADRMANSEFELREVEGQGLSATGKFLGNVPGGNYAQSKEFQRYDQARRSFINAVLRKESGAVISPDEFDNANKQYFAQPGDDKGIVAQKARERTIALDGMKRSAGPAYKPKGEASEKPAAVKKYRIENGVLVEDK